MTVSSETFKVQYNGDGSTTEFGTVFLFAANADVTVVHRDASGTETTWSEGTEYTLTGAGGDVAGTVTAGSAYIPASGETLTIKRDPAKTQPTSLTRGGPLPSSDVEAMVDRVVYLVQALQEQLDRSVKLTATTAESNHTLPDITGGTGQYLQVNSGETGYDLVTPVSGAVITTPVAINQGGTASTTAAAARSALTADPDDLSQDDDMVIAQQVFGG